MRPLAVLACIVMPMLAGCALTPDDPERAGEPAAPFRWPPPEDAALRPGDKLRADEVREDPDRPQMRGCTLNFVFTSIDGASVYIGTASHCLTPEDPARPHRIGDPWTLAGGVRATIAYCGWGDGEDCLDLEPGSPGYENDFALLRIDDADRARVHPALRHWGGPTALAVRPPAPGAAVKTYGNSYLRDAGGALSADPLDAREGSVVESDRWATTLRFSVTSVHGDSGGPVILADGAALGILQNLRTQPRPGDNGAVNLAAALDAMAERGGVPVRLATWPLA